MIDVLQILGLIFVVLAMVPALAHALELPGKLRLKKEAYFAVQPIYYPGFTIMGITEPVAIIATIALLLLAPWGSTDFWLKLVALLGLVGMHAVYWLFTHPVNNFWLRGENLSGPGSRFFSLGSGSKQGQQSAGRSEAWTALRDRWEHSHVARAILAFLSFVALVIAISLD